MRIKTKDGRTFKLSQKAVTLLQKTFSVNSVYAAFEELAPHIALADRWEVWFAIDDMYPGSAFCPVLQQKAGELR